MKFILMVEEAGYQLRFWNEQLNEIGPIVASSWDKNDLYKKLQIKQFHVDKKVFAEAIKKIELEEKPFVVLKSQENPDTIDFFIKDTFTIDNSEE